MKRRWVYLRDIEIWDSMHHEESNEFGFTCNEGSGEEADTKRHREGVDYVKRVIESGQKVMPILVADNGDGTYTRLDGFKRCFAHKELGKEIIECFICDKVECATQQRIPYANGEMWCGKGGQPNKVFLLFEGEENENPENIKFLYNSPSFRIEIRENIHIHWGEAGKNRLEVGLKDFMELADIFEKL